MDFLCLKGVFMRHIKKNGFFAFLLTVILCFWGTGESKAGLVYANEDTTIDGIDYEAVFDAEYYGQAYPDALLQCANRQELLLKHFIDTGMKEGRRGNEEFDLFAYMENNPDVVLANPNNDYSFYYLHYILCGKEEGRSAIDIFEDKEDSVYDILVSFKEQYPEGMYWTNEQYYDWNGGTYYRGYGCAGFAFILSDAAFGDVQAVKHTDYSNIRVGDILRVNNNTHMVIVLEVHDDYVIVAEGNYNSSIHWGRKIYKNRLQGEGDYIMTRYE